MCCKSRQRAVDKPFNDARTAHDLLTNHRHHLTDVLDGTLRSACCHDTRRVALQRQEAQRNGLQSKALNSITLLSFLTIGKTSMHMLPTLSRKRLSSALTTYSEEHVR